MCRSSGQGVQRTSAGADGLTGSWSLNAESRCRPKFMNELTGELVAR